MADYPGGSRDDARVSESVLDWLDEIAEAEGLSREEAVEYLISSYWRLEEIVDLLEDGDVTPAGVEDTSAPELPPPSDVDGLHDRFDSLLDDLRGADGEPADPYRLLSALVELSNRLERLESTLVPTASSGSTGGDDLADERSTLDARVESLETSLADVEAQVDDVADAAVNEETFAAVTDQTRSFQDAITRQHDALRDRVQTEFDHIRTILTHLLDVTATNEARTDRLAELEADLEALRSERDTLAAIIRTANRRGVSEADCEHCGQTVDLSMLDSPVCPSCEHSFTDLETAGGWFGLFPSAVLTVAARSGRR